MLQFGSKRAFQSSRFGPARHALFPVRHAGSVGMYPQFLRERPDVPAIDIARFILEEVKPHADDFVVRFGTFKHWDNSQQKTRSLAAFD
jgi:hypothetical protein